MTQKSRPSRLEAFEIVRRAGLPSLHLSRSIEFLEQHAPAEWKDVRDRVCGRIGGGWIVGLLGIRGPGKTQIAQQAVVRAAAAGRTALYTRAMRIFLELKSTFHSKSAESELDVVERYTSPGLLVIDEFHVRGETKFEDDKLDYILDVRYGDMKDTLIIANLTPATFKKTIGDSITDRMYETGGIIECNWPSMRKVLRSLRDQARLPMTSVEPKE